MPFAQVLMMFSVLTMITPIWLLPCWVRMPTPTSLMDKPVILIMLWLAQNLVAQITGVTDWHINADEADLIDYDTSFKGPNQDAIYAPDAYRSSDHDPVIIGLDVCDEIAPTFDEVSVSPDELWPANHKYVDVTATVVVSDNFDTSPTVELVSVTSNEADDGLGDGDTANDIVIVDDFHFKLRAERSGTSAGRIYTITYKVTDACGNSTMTTVTVSVPHSKSK